MRPLAAACLFHLLASPLLCQQSASLDSAISLFEAGRYDEAEAILQSIHDADRRNARALYYLGRIDMAQGEHDDAEDHFKDAIELQPHVADYHLWLGQAYHEKMIRAGALGRMSLANRAKAAFEEVLRLDSDNIDARVWLANFRWRAPGIAGGDKDKALEHVREIERRDPLTAHGLLGSLYFDSEDYAAAEAEFLEVVEIDPSNSDAHFMLGRIYQEGQEYEQASAAFEAAIAADSTDLKSYYQLGRTGVFSGQNLDRAAEALRLYIARGPGPDSPSLASAHWRLGMVYERRGELALARRQYEAALALEPEHEEAKKALRNLGDSAAR